MEEFYDKMFIGEYQHALDNKNRIIIPSKFREKLKGSIVMTKGLDGCLYVFTLDEWEILDQKLKTLPLSSKDARTFIRFFFSGAAEVDIDKQGRVLIPQNLIEYAGIFKEIVTIGVSNRIEIWSKENWNEFNNQNINYNAIAEKMAELGI